MSTSATGYRQPAYRITVDGKDITQSLDGRLTSLTITDNRGLEADQLDIVIDDHDGKLGLPSRGAVLNAAIGWSGEQLVDKGGFTIDEVEHSGAPDQLTVRARSADMRGGITTQKERSWSQIALGELVKVIAGEANLSPAVADKLAGQIVEQIDQTNESSANLLSRLAQQFDAIASIKGGKLLFMPAAAGLSVSGKRLPGVKITRQDGDQHRFAISDRENYTHVKASYYDRARAVKGEVIWSQEREDAELRAHTPNKALTINPKIKEVAGTLKTRSTAITHAKKEWKKLSRQPGNTFTAVKVAYNDKSLGVKSAITYGAADEANRKTRAQRLAAKDSSSKPEVAINASADNIKTLRHVYAYESTAKRAARAEWRRLQRGLATFGITLAYGRPELFPDRPATVSGWKPEIDNTDWIISRVTHQLSNSGFTTSVELEIRATELGD